LTDMYGEKDGTPTIIHEISSSVSGGGTVSIQ